MGILTLLLPFIPDLVKGVEGIFKDKPKSGIDKMEAVVTMLRPLIDKMLALQVPLNGTPLNPASTITDDALRGATEGIVQDLKATGQLDTKIVTTPTSIPAAGLYVIEVTGNPMKIR